MDTDRYDIFLSYRRRGGFETAKHLFDLLTRDGYSVSFDIDTLRAGDFDTTLLRRIDQCTDFILILDREAFDRTLDPAFDRNKDWMRIELAYALDKGKNIIPVMFGVWLGAYGMHYEPNYPALQLAGLFGTTLAPVAGHFGPVCGILAGFIHSALVLQTGGPVAGLNLYNNGFSGGLIAIVLYPTLTAIIRHRRPKLRDADYYDLFEADQPINMSNWHTHRPTPEEKAAEAAGRMTDDLPEREGFQRMQKNEKKENG